MWPGKNKNDEEGDDAQTESQREPTLRAENADYETLIARMAEAEKQRDEHLASWQRSQADYQNLRRRLQTDIDTAVQRAKGPLLSELLLVLDYLDMALATNGTTPEEKQLFAGVEMTKSQLVRALEREGVKLIPESGPFDAAVHQAVQSVETTAAKPGDIVATMRRGYTQGATVLRPAQVKVAVAPKSNTAEDL